MKKNYKIKKVSSKQQKVLRKYAKLRKEFLEKNPLCKINLPDCTRKATEIHHSGKKHSEELWLDTSLFVPCCNTCHRQIEMSPALAKKLGLYNYNI